MHVLIVEDEEVIARRLARLVSGILGPGTTVEIAQSVADARALMTGRRADLVMLDLSLEGEDGFELLRYSAAQAFETIVVSAHSERALEAFEYGVRDFVPKPFSRARLERALQRVMAPSVRGEHALEFLGVRRSGGIEFVRVDDVVYIRGAGTRSEVVLARGVTLMHERMLDRLEGVLPRHFERIHRSYIVDLRRAARLLALEGSRYALVLADGTRLPVGRTRVAALRQRLG